MLNYNALVICGLQAYMLLRLVKLLELSRSVTYGTIRESMRAT